MKNKKTRKLLAILILIAFNVTIFLLVHCAAFKIAFVHDINPKTGEQSSGYAWKNIGFGVLFFLGAAILFYIYRFKVLLRMNDKFRCVTEGMVALITVCCFAIPILSIISGFRNNFPTLFFDEWKATATDASGFWFIVINVGSIILVSVFLTGMFELPKCPKCGLIGDNALNLINSRETNRSTRNYTYHEDVYTGTSSSTATVTMSDGSTHNVDVEVRNYERVPRSGTRTTVTTTCDYRCNYCGHVWTKNHDSSY